jgi:hypothetical protein
MVVWYGRVPYHHHTTTIPPPLQLVLRDAVSSAERRRKPICDATRRPPTMCDQVQSGHRNDINNVTESKPVWCTFPLRVVYVIFLCGGQSSCRRCHHHLWETNAKDTHVDSCIVILYHHHLHRRTNSLPPPTLSVSFFLLVYNPLDETFFSCSI